MDLKIAGKRALVTGGSKGIGFEIAERLKAEGCDVVIASRSLENLASAARAIPGVETIQLNLADESGMRKALVPLCKNNPFDILVINSGGPPPGFLKDLTLEKWDEGYRLILRSVLVLTEICVPAMREKKWGRVLSINSTSAVQIISNLPISGTLRAGLSAWVKHAAKEWGRDGILVNNLLPGPTNTSRLSELKEKNPEVVQKMFQESALGRFAEAFEIANVAAFLCSGANTYLTGSNVLVDGGFTAGV